MSDDTPIPTWPAALEDVAVTLKMHPGDVPIEMARDAYPDGDEVYTAVWPLFLATYPGMTLKEYWRLTVLEHAAGVWTARQINPNAAKAIDSYREAAKSLAPILEAVNDDTADEGAA